MPALALWIFPVLMAFAAASDLLTMRISNRLVLLLVIGFFPVAILAQLSFLDVGLHLFAALIVLIGGFALFALGVMGGGDAKLAAATTLWLGFGFTLHYLVYAALLGGALTLLILALRSLPLDVWFARIPWLARLHDRKQGVPYGIALAAAAMIVYAQTQVFLSLSA